MSDTPLKGSPKLTERDRLIVELLEETSREIGWIRDADRHLGALDAKSWQTTRQVAHNLAARADALKLAVLARGAQELELFASKVLSKKGTDKASDVYSAQVAIELIELELQSLRKEFDIG